VNNNDSLVKLKLSKKQEKARKRLEMQESKLMKKLLKIQKKKQ